MPRPEEIIKPIGGHPCAAFEMERCRTDRSSQHERHYHVDVVLTLAPDGDGGNNKTAHHRLARCGDDHGI